MPKILLEENVLIGKRLHDARKIRRVSQKAIAGHLGVTFQQVQKYENGVNRLSSTSLLKVAQVLDFPIDFFIQDINGVKLNPDWSEDSRELLDLYNKLPQAQRKAALKIMKAMIE